MIKGLFQQKDISYVNIYTPNIGALKYIKQILTSLKGELDHSTVIVGDFSIPPSTMDRSSRKKSNKEILDLNHTLDHVGLTDIYGTLHPTVAAYTLFSKAHGTFSRLDHTTGHKTGLSHFKKIEIIPNIFFWLQWYGTRNQ